MAGTSASRSPAHQGLVRRGRARRDVRLPAMRLLAGLAVLMSAAAAVAEPVEPARVERVRYEADGRQTRVIVMLSRVVPHEVMVLPGDAQRGSRQRLVVDLSNARLGPAARVPMGAEHGILQRIRTGQFTARTARVVLDLAGVGTHSVVALDNPPRLVIDVAAPPGTVMARPRAPEPRPPAPAEARTAVMPPPAAAAQETPPRTDAPMSTARTAKVATPGAESAARGAPAPPRPAAVPAVERAPAAAPVEPPPRLRAEPPPVPPRVMPPPSVAEEDLAAPTLDLAPPAPAPRPEVREAAAPSPAATARRQRLAPPLAPAPPWRIVLDPGHGGNDPGARGVDGILEKDVTLIIARKLKRRLEDELSATVLLTRDGDATRSLAERTAFANASRADLFLSIHANADDAGKLRGIETYTLNNSNDRATIRLAKMENGPHLRVGRGDLSFILSDMVQSSKEEESIALAERVHSRLLSRLRSRYPDVRNLGVKKGPFYVLVGAYMPCVLIETSFLSHPVEGRRLASEEYQADVAEGVFLGVRDFLEDARLAKTL